MEHILKKKSEQIFCAPAAQLAKEYARAGGHTYRYSFSWMEGKHVLGAIHILDILPLFGLGDAENQPISLGLTKDEVQNEGRAMREIWTKFAHDGTISSMGVSGMISIAPVQP
ncbi:MAG: hypothetical protein ACOX4F_06385 [Atopobiaceae bacterium]